VDIVFGSRHPPRGVDNITTRPVAPVDAPTSAGARHHQTVVDKSHLGTGIINTGVEVPKILPYFGEITDPVGIGKVPEAKIHGICARLEILEKILGVTIVDHLDIDIVDLAGARRLKLAILVGPAPVRCETEIYRDVRSVQVFPGQVSHRTGGQRLPRTVPALHVGDVLAMVPVAQEDVIVRGFRIVEDGGGNVHNGCGFGIRHRHPEFQEFAPGVTVSTLGVIGTTGWDVDVSAPGRVVGRIRLVVIADVPVAHRWLRDVIMGPPVPGGVALGVLEITVEKRFAGLVGGIAMGGHQVDGISPGLGQVYTAPVDNFAATGKPGNFTSLGIRKEKHEKDNGIPD